MKLIRQALNNTDIPKGEQMKKKIEDHALDILGLFIVLSVQILMVIKAVNK